MQIFRVECFRGMKDSQLILHVGLAQQKNRHMTYAIPGTSRRNMRLFRSLFTFWLEEWEQALWTLASCKRRELQPHVVAYNTVISTLAECRWEVALLIFHEALMYSRPDVITYNAAISASAAGSCWQAALHFLTSAKEGLVQCDVQGSVVWRDHFVFWSLQYLCLVGSKNK